MVCACVNSSRCPRMVKCVGLGTPSCGQPLCSLMVTGRICLKVLSTLGRCFRTTGSKLKEKNPLAGPQTGLSKWFVALTHSYNGIYFRRCLIRTWLQPCQPGKRQRSFGCVHLAVGVAAEARHVLALDAFIGRRIVYLEDPGCRIEYLVSFCLFFLCLVSFSYRF